MAWSSIQREVNRLVNDSIFEASAFEIWRLVMVYRGAHAIPLAPGKLLCAMFLRSMPTIANDRVPGQGPLFGKDIQSFNIVWI